MPEQSATAWSSGYCACTHPLSLILNLPAYPTLSAVHMQSVRLGLDIGHLCLEAAFNC